MENIFVARQPIYNRALKVVAYELLYRDGGTNRAAFEDGNHATTQVLLNTFLEFGERVVGSRTAFINLTRAFIVGDYPMPLSRDNVVLEVLEDIEPEAAVLAGLQRLRDAGFVLALDDFVTRPGLEPLLELAHIVKVEVMGRERAELAEELKRLQPFKVKLLAEKVETPEELKICQELGFHYFQGYFFCKPDVMSGRRSGVNRPALLNLLAQLQNPEADMDEVQLLIAQDASLAYRLLRYINSAFFGLPRTIESIKQAAILLGLTTVRNWVTLLLMARIDDKPQELITTAMVRAKMAQQLALCREDADPHQAFTVGLFSVLDAMLDEPLEELLEQIPLSDEPRAALLRHDGPLGAILTELLAYESGEWERLGDDPEEVATLREAYLGALEWAGQSMQALRNAG